MPPERDPRTPTRPEPPPPLPHPSRAAGFVLRYAPVATLAVSLLYAVALLIGNAGVIAFFSVVLSVLLAVLMGLIALMAGAVVLRSLFAVAAELSLLIFITQAYCMSPGRTAASQTAMSTLFTVGVIYVVVIFGRELWEALRATYGRVSASRRSFQRVLTVAGFVFFVALFLWQLTLVMQPIIGGLCVYR
ncbi:MAG TPA: hypothetical protein VMT99_00470 [Candidatus Paceibacterota bacterium]|nr:hypothetical protein [Candidatus Paceibacterota bacterium]